MNSSTFAVNAISLPEGIMKGRPRGESDLGRPNAKPNGIMNGHTFSSVAERRGSGRLATHILEEDIAAPLANIFAAHGFGNSTGPS